MIRIYRGVQFRLLSLWYICQWYLLKSISKLVKEIKFINPLHIRYYWTKRTSRIPVSASLREGKQRKNKSVVGGPCIIRMKTIHLNFELVAIDINGKLIRVVALERTYAKHFIRCRVPRWIQITFFYLKEQSDKQTTHRETSVVARSLTGFIIFLSPLVNFTNFSSPSSSNDFNINQNYFKDLHFCFRLRKIRSQSQTWSSHYSREDCAFQLRAIRHQY